MLCPLKLHGVERLINMARRSKSFELKLLVLLFVCLLAASNAGNAQEQFDAAAIIRSINQPNSSQQTEANLAPVPWWNEQVVQPFRGDKQSTHVDLNSLFFVALKNSVQLKVYSEVPLIRETAIAEADAAFDWNQYLNSLWEDIDVPVGSSLTVGGAGTRFENQNLGITAGLRKRSRNGVTVDLSQRIGHQDTNSNFFIPRNQGTSQLSLGVTVPLLRGSGQVYNQSLTVLAGIDAETAGLEFSRQLQSHLLEITRAYWSLYRERAILAQKIKLYVRTKSINDKLLARRQIDVTPSQLASSQAALENQKADLVRAQAAIMNAETRLRTLVNADELGETEFIELIPSQAPALHRLEVDLIQQVETGIQNRPEVAAAVKEINAACVRLNMAKHEMLPALNLITETYLSGLRGNSDIGQSWIDQFSDTPSYSVGLNYEVPIGNRAAMARKRRRSLELRQLNSQYRNTIETVKAEIEVAVRELETSHREMLARYRTVLAAEQEVNTMQERWNQMAGGDGNSSLTLESLLRAQERVAESENAYSTSQLTYNLALMNLSRANGTLLATEKIELGRVCENCLPRVDLQKLDLSMEQQPPEMIAPADIVPSTESGSDPPPAPHQSRYDYFRK